MSAAEDFHFPKLVVHRITEEEGRKYRQSLTSPVCDFCFDERVRWDYNCADFTIQQHNGEIWASSNGWAACEECSELIERKLWNDLVVRIAHAWLALGKNVKADHISDCGLMVHGFADHYEPGRIAFG